MSVKSGQAVTVEFITSSFTTGAATNADSLPTGTLVVNGTDNAAVVTVTNVDAGRYKAAVTLPTLAVNDVVELVAAATVGGVAGKGVVWRDAKDILLDAGGNVAVASVTVNPSGLITVTGPVASGGAVSVIQGDSYFAADGRALVWTNAAGSWPDLTGAAVNCYVYTALPGGPAATFAAAVVTPSGPNQQLRLELTSAQSAALPARAGAFAVRATLASGHVATLVDSTWTTLVP